MKLKKFIDFFWNPKGKAHRAINRFLIVGVIPFEIFIWIILLFI